MGYDFRPHKDLKMMFIFYDEVMNCFYNTRGERIQNIFSILTPGDLLLFRNDPGCCTFRTPFPQVVCEICTMEEGYTFLGIEREENQYGTRKRHACLNLG
jgi:hypothetical protein